MTNFKEYHPLAFYAIIIIVIMVGSLFLTRNDIDTYEYVDASGNIGYSKKCIPNIPYSVCYDDNGEKIKVIKFYEFEK